MTVTIDRATTTSPTDVPRPSHGAGPTRRTRRALPWISALVLFSLYVTLSVRRHLQLMTSGYDLGIFEQSVRSYAAGHLPVSTLKGPGYPLLGDHFSPIVATIAPLYRVFPSPVTLLVAQAALLSVAVVPLSAWALREAGRRVALVVVVVYGLSWGIAQAVGFDFHEVAFGVPLLAFATVALGDGRLRHAVLWAAPLVLVKEDLGLTVAMLGLLVVLRGRRRLGLLTAAGGVVATALEMGVVIPAINPGGSNAYVGQIDSGGLAHQLAGILSPDTKIVTLVLLLAPTAFIALRSPLLLLVVPTLGWRFLSSNPAYWGMSFHYSAVLMPIVVAALIDGLRRHRGRRWPVLAVSVLVTAWLVPQNPFAQLASPGLWQTDARVVAVNQVLARIPSGTSVSASNWLAPQLTSRDDVSVFGFTPLTTSHAEYVVADTRELGTFPVLHEQQAALLLQARGLGYAVIDQVDGVVLLHRTSAPVEH